MCQMFRAPALNKMVNNLHHPVNSVFNLTQTDAFLFQFSSGEGADTHTVRNLGATPPTLFFT